MKGPVAAMLEERVSSTTPNVAILCYELEVQLRLNNPAASAMIMDFIETPLSFIKSLDNGQIEEQEAKRNPYLADALAQEKYDGHRLAIFARTVALIIFAFVLPILTPRLDVLFYVAIIVLFILSGWLQLRAARVGQSRRELLLIFVDLVLLTTVFIVPNPFLPHEIPTVIVYRFDSFIVFFLFLALGTLAYSWRTVWAMGFWIAGFWIIGLVAVALFGHTLPDLSVRSAELYKDNELLRFVLDPNGFQLAERIEEIIIIVMVSVILGLKGARSNRLLIQQARVAAERANLSRYFPSSLVDTLASTDHDIGAVRNQNVAVLFTDIVGFTEYAERSSPEEVMALLRAYHSLVETAVFDNAGTLDKYLGDGAMATFGTPEAGPDDARNALAAARQILRETDALNLARVQDGHEAVRVSLGLHFGPVTLGDIGSARRLEFAVIGDTVNVASRLEAASRELECQCVVSDDLMRKAGGDRPVTSASEEGFAVRQGVQLRGRNTPIDVWTF